MTIKTKQDLINTYIVNDCPVKRDAYIAKMKEHGIRSCADPEFEYLKNSNIIICSTEFSKYGQAEHDDSYNSEFCKKELHLSDLIDLENSKVYTTDIEVVRKYSKLCKKQRVVCVNFCGAFNRASNLLVVTFKRNTGPDFESGLRVITVDQVNALYAEKQKQAATTTTKESKVEIDYELAEKIGATHYDTRKSEYGFTLYQISAMGNLAYYLEDVWCKSSIDASSAIKFIKPIPPKPPVTVKYEKLTFDKASEAVKAWEDGILYTRSSHEDHVKVATATGAITYIHDLYRRIEKPIDWRECAHDYLNKNTGYHWSAPIGEIINDEGGCFLKVCEETLKAAGRR